MRQSCWLVVFALALAVSAPRADARPVAVGIIIAPSPVVVAPPPVVYAPAPVVVAPAPVVAVPVYPRPYYRTRVFVGRGYPRYRYYR